MVKKIFFFVISSVLVFAATIYYRLGAYKDVEIKIEDRASLNLLYKEHFGAYHKINDVIVAVENWARENNLKCDKTFGEYLDDPRIVDERHLRSYGGCILTEALTLTTPFKFKTVPARRYVIAHFTGAPSLGPLKVYPAVEDFMKSQKIAPSPSIIEIYDQSKTEYLF